MCGKFPKVIAHQPQMVFRSSSDISVPGTPLPERLHLSRPRYFKTVDPDVSNAYELELSSPMRLNGGL